MRVLHSIDALGVGGGAEHSLALMLPLLRDRGVESSVACILPREGGLQARLKEQGFKVDVLQAQSWPGRVWALRRTITNTSPDLVHGSLFNSNLLTRLACVGLGLPLLNSLVNTSYDPTRAKDLGIPRWKLGAARVIDGMTARHLVDHFHAVSESVRDEAVGILGISPSRVTVIPRGRPATHLGERSELRRKEVRQRLGLGYENPVLLTVGRQDRQKAHASLIRAFARVRAQMPSSILLIAGREGDASAEVRDTIAGTGVNEAVRLLGHRSDVPDLCAAADVFVFPSLYEGMGGSLIEAMALATPIIGSDAPAVREALGDGECGVIVPRGDDVALADAMLELLTDPQRGAEYGRRGRHRFLERYEIEKVADAMLAMYRSVLEG